MNEPKISIIIPVYNSEKTLYRCVDSILAQSFSEFEAIFVDDCSSDGSMALLHAYIERDARLKVITLDENRGAGNARNIGIECARGEYLSFVDSDDEIAPDFLELLYNKAVESGADIIKGSCLRVCENGSDKDSNRLKMLYRNKRFVSCMKAGEKLFMFFKEHHFSAIYRRAFIIGRGIRYGASLVGEDCTFLLKVGAAANSIACEYNAVYCYHNLETSLTNSVTVERFDGIVDSLREQFEFIDKAGLDPADAAAFMKVRLRIRLEMHSFLLRFEDKGALAARYKKSLYDVVSGCGLADRIKELDYGIGVFLRSGGEENISVLGSVNGHYDKTAIHLDDLKRLAEHLAHSPFRADGGMKYLAYAVAHIYSDRSLTSVRGLPECRSMPEKAMHDALAPLNTPELLCQMDVATRALVEYGAVISLTPERRRLPDAADFEFLTNAITMLKAHPDAWSGYYAFAERLSERLLIHAFSIRKKEGVHGDELIARIADMIAELKRLKENSAMCDGVKK